MSIYLGKVKVTGSGGGGAGNEHVIISKADYEALPEDKKQSDIVYMISDDVENINYVQLVNYKGPDINGNVDIFTQWITPITNNGQKIASFKNEDGSTEYLYALSASYTPIATSGFECGKLTINGSEQTIYAQNVSVDTYYSSGNKIATISVDDVITDIYSPSSVANVSVDTYYSSGNKIATISVDDVITDIYSPKNEQQISSIYRWQSNTDKFGRYSWFEIWPDGWCRQGGETAVKYDLSGLCDVSIPLPFKSIGKTNVMCQSLNYNLSTLTSNKLGREMIYTFNKEGSTKNSLKIANNILSGTSYTESFFWTAEGFRDTELCTLTDISAKYSLSGTWSSNIIGLNGTYSGGYGCGVIDGTVLTSYETTLVQTKDTITSSLYSEDVIYTVQNDCLLYCNFHMILAQYGINMYVNNTSPVWSLDESISPLSASYDYGVFSTTIPVKKGSKISVRRRGDFFNERGYKTVWGNQISTDVIFTEYKLNSLAPQIAMPDYSNKRDIDLTKWTYDTTTNLHGTINVTENGYISLQLIEINESNIGGFFIRVNGTLIQRESSNYNGYQIGRILFPVSKGDVVTIGNEYGRYDTRIDNTNSYACFIPCKSVPQPDCASYVISSWHEDTEWCRIYSDGWCEQGGKGYIIGYEGGYNKVFHKPFIDTNYTVMAENIKMTNEQPNSGRLGSVPYVLNKATNSITFDYNGGSFVGDILWEAKGWIK